MARSYIRLFFDWTEATAELDDAEKGRLIDAMLAYARGDSYRLSGNERFVFPVFKRQIDRDAAAYEEVCEKRRQAGAKGGKQKLANASNCNQELAKPSKTSEDKDQDKDKDKDKDQDKEGYNTRARARAPTVEEVRTFMLECCPRGDAARGAERFWNHYEGIGWNVADWKPLARNWIEEDSQKIPAPDYAQRGGTDYSARIVDLTKEDGYNEQ